MDEDRQERADRAHDGDGTPAGVESTEQERTQYALRQAGAAILRRVQPAVSVYGDPGPRWDRRLEANDTCFRTTACPGSWPSGGRSGIRPGGARAVQERWKEYIAESLRSDGPVTGEVDYTLADGSVRMPPSPSFYNRNRTEDEWKQVLNGELLEMPREIYIQSDPARMYKVMRQTAKTCFAFKILAAGRIADGSVAQAFRTYASIKPHDGVYVGVFPKDKDEIRENAELVHSILTTT